MSFTVYAIYSKSIDIIYGGQTNNIKTRIKDHCLGNSKFSSRENDWELFYTENKETRSEAIVREKQLKTSRGRVFLRDKIKQDW